MNHLAIFIGVFVLAFCLIALLDEFAAWAERRRASRRATSADWEDSARPDTNVFGAEFRCNWDWPK